MGGLEKSETTTFDVESGGGGEEMMKKTKKGICLTWKDVWVVAAAKNSSKKNKNYKINNNGSSSSSSSSERRIILEGLTGYAKPGQLLAIMGPSGCGKSTLLDTLAGRLGSNICQTGEILINGHKQALAYGTSAYVTQDDTLLTTLTVKEAIHYSAQLQLPDTMSTQEKKERADLTLKEMGLQDAMNTRIGGWGCKGISGGQKRRVSICIEILTRPTLLFLDEPTSGLDSAASYYVMRAIKSLQHKDGIPRTIIASIHQPSTEVFHLFDQLSLLSSGRTVYFGPAPSASQFFASNGFPCPLVQNPSDHFLKTINKDFDQDITEPAGSAGTQRKTATEEAIEILVNSYKSSEMNHQVQAEVAALSAKDRNLEKKRKSKGHAGFVTQCIVLTKRSSLNMCRDLGYYWLRLAVYVALALCLGTVFSDLDTSYGSIRDRVSLLGFVTSFMTFMTIGGFPSFVEDMKVFERERLNGHYGVTSYVIGNTMSSIPYLLIVSLIPGSIAYFLPGLQRSFHHFFYFSCVLFSCLMLVESLMMIVATIVPNFLMGIITGAGIQGIMLLAAGFFRLPHDLPTIFWKYPMFYFAFHRYANQGSFKNEFQGLTFNIGDVTSSSSKRVSSLISGDEVLRSMWQVNMSYSKWVDLGVLVGMIVFYRVMFLVIIKASEKLKPKLASLLSLTPKRKMQIMANPNATPLH